MTMHAAATLQDPILAEEILNHLLDTKQGFKVMVLFNIVIDVWAKSGRADAAQRAEAVLQTMIDLNNEGRQEISPNVVSYTSVIQAWANSNHDEAPRRAEELLYEMQRRGLQPNKLSYSSVLTAWARSNVQHAPTHAILKHMHKLNENGMTMLKPDSFNYASVISAFANRGDVQEAENLLVELCERYKSTRNLDDLPSAVCFSAVINAWSESGRPDAPINAERILEQMQKFATSWNESSLVPNFVTFTSVLKAWSRTGCGSIQYSLALWAKSSNREAPERAESILRRMHQMWQAGRSIAKPNTICYTTVMKAWTRSRNLDAARRVQALFDEMIERCKAGDLELKPDIVIFSSLIDAWAEAGEPEKAERVLRDAEVLPNVQLYNMAIKAWAKSHTPYAAERAQALFDELFQKYQTGNKKMKPNLITYSNLVTVWGRSKQKDSAKRAQAIFDDFISRSNGCDREMRPDVVICNALIDAWAKAGEPERAEQVLRDVNMGKYVGVKPNVISYNAVMNGWSHSRHVRAAERMQALYDEMKRKYEGGDRNVNPGVDTFRVLLTAWCNCKPTREGDWVGLSVWNDVEERCQAGEADLKQLLDSFRPRIDPSSTVNK